MLLRLLAGVEEEEGSNLKPELKREGEEEWSRDGRARAGSGGVGRGVDMLWEEGGEIEERVRK